MAKKAKVAKVAKNPVGRPTKYRKAYCQQIIDHMSEGYSIEAFAGKLGISKNTLYDWLKLHEDFADAKQVGTSASQLWWETAGRKGMFTPAFSSSVWIFNMKNRHGWVDKKESIEDKNIQSIRINLPNLGQQQVISMEPGQITEGSKDE